MKRKLFSVITILALCLITAVAADPTKDAIDTLDLSNTKKDVTDQWDSQGYKWENVVTDPYSGEITGGTLTLANGFNAAEVILPDAAVTIVTNGEASIRTLTPPDASGSSSPEKMQLIFSGGKLTVHEHMEISGGDGNILTVKENATLVVEDGISIGSSGGVNSLVTVDGTLTVKQAPKSSTISAICAGKVAVGDTGVLEVSGERGLFLTGMNNPMDFSSLFTVEGNGCFTANCSEYTVRATPPGDSFPDGTTAIGMIPLGEQYLPSDCEARISTDGKPEQLDLIDKATGEPYKKPLTIHLNHDWNSHWSFDGGGHWHGCSYVGCDKKSDEASHSLSQQKGDAGHWQKCTDCGYETDPAAHTPSADYKSDATDHWHICMECGYKIDRENHIPDVGYHYNATDHWHICTECGSEVERAAHRPPENCDSDTENHWYTCVDCNYETGHVPHNWVYQHDEGNHWQECSVCGKRKEQSDSAHVLSWQGAAAGHWQECTVCGRRTAVQAHVYDGDRDTSCNLCGYTRTISGGGSTGGGSGGGGSSVSTYAVTVEKSEYGKVASNRTRASSGSTVTLTITPDSGYELDTITITDSRGGAIRLTAQDGGKYTFTMPGRAVTVKAAFAPLPAEQPCDGGTNCPSRGFADLGGPGTWYHEAVDFVLRSGLMDGYGSGLFGPDNALTRAQLVQILYNHAGRPAVTGSGSFTDVAAGMWCADAVAWAAERGIVGGYGDGRFGPNDNITREQLAVMLWRYAGSPAAAGQGWRFTDADKASGYALEALRWAAESGVLNGYSNGQLDPGGPATRAQTAQMLKHLIERQEGNI